MYVYIYIYMYIYEYKTDLNQENNRRCKILPMTYNSTLIQNS